MSKRDYLFSISDVIIFTHITFEAKQARNGLPTEFRSSREKRSKDVCEWDWNPLFAGQLTSDQLLNLQQQ